jgi:hypothetical protein
VAPPGAEATQCVAYLAKSRKHAPYTIHHTLYTIDYNAKKTRLIPSSASTAVYSSLSPRGGGPATMSLFSQVWKHLLDSKEDLGHVASYRFDLVDVAR